MTKQRDATLHAIGVNGVQTPTAPNAARGAEQQELAFSPGGVQSGAAVSEDGVTVPLKTEHILPYDPAAALLCIDPDEVKTPHKTPALTAHRCPQQLYP